jgi:rhodanese-related sulfurtransferase
MKTFKKYISIPILLVGFVYLSSMMNIKLPSITVSKLNQLILKNKNTEIIDVRTKTEYYGPLGHIQNAKLRPLLDINKTIDEYKNSKYSSNPLYVICRSGNRSSKATKELRDNGINAINVKGGMNQWVQYKKKKNQGV